jgi:hypothetical protein
MVEEKKDFLSVPARISRKSFRVKGKDKYRN